MMSKYLTVNTTIEWLCLITALVCLSKDKSSAWRSMIVLMLFTCIAETIGIHIKGKYIADMVNVRPNIWVYNILLVFQAGFISAMLAHLFRRYKNMNLFIYSGLGVLVIMYLFEVYSHGIYERHTITRLVMQFLFVVYCFVYFYLLLKDESYVDLRKDAAFWWVAGVLLFFFGSMIINLFYEAIRERDSTKLYSRYIYYALNLMLYGCWSYAFILRKWANSRSRI